MMRPRMERIERNGAKLIFKQADNVGYPLLPLSELAIRICLAYNVKQIKLESKTIT